MNAYVGSDASTPASPCTSMKKNTDRPSVPMNDASTVSDEDDRRDDRLQQHPEDDRDHEQRDGDDHAQVALGRLVEVGLHRAARADERAHARPGSPRAGRAARPPARARPPSTGRRGRRRRAARCCPSSDAHRRRDARDALDALQRLPHGREVRVARPARPRAATSTRRRPQRARPGTPRPRTSKPVDALDVLLEEPADRVVLLVGEAARASRSRRTRRSRRA